MTNRCLSCDEPTGFIHGLAIVVCASCSRETEKEAKKTARMLGGDWREHETLIIDQMETERDRVFRSNESIDRPMP